MKYRYIYLFFLFALLIGCSQGGETISTKDPSLPVISPLSTSRSTVTVEPTTSPELFTYVALGDSIPFCWAANTVCYPELLAEYVQQSLGEDLEFKNLAINGDRTEHLLGYLKNDPVIRDAVATADLITIWIMVNDLLGAPPMLYKNNMCGGDDNLDCVRDRVEYINQNIDEILDEILALNTAEDAQFMIADTAIPAVAMIEWKQWEIFDIMKKEYFEPIQSHIVMAAEERNFVVVQSYAAINGPIGDVENEELYIEDGLHFNNLGNRLIVDLHIQALENAK